MLTVLLRSSPGRLGQVELREPSGADESSIGGAGERAFARLLSRLIELEGTHAEKVAVMNQISLSDRDRIAVRLHQHLFSDRVELIVGCGECAERYELEFQLSSLEGQIFGDAWTRIPDAAGVFDHDGLRFRLPNIGDVDRVSGSPAEAAAAALRSSCTAVVGTKGGPVDNDRLDRLLEACGPLLSLELDCQCPHCETPARVAFDVVDFFMRSLQREGKWLIREAHCLARAYGWSLTEIMDLPRTQRRSFVGLIAGGAETSGRARA